MATGGWGGGRGRNTPDPSLHIGLPHSGAAPATETHCPAAVDAASPKSGASRRALGLWASLRAAGRPAALSPSARLRFPDGARPAPARPPLTSGRMCISPVCQEGHSPRHCGQHSTAPNALPASHPAPPGPSASRGAVSLTHFILSELAGKGVSPKTEGRVAGHLLAPALSCDPRGPRRGTPAADARRRPVWTPAPRNEFLVNSVLNYTTRQTDSVRLRVLGDQRENGLPALGGQRHELRRDDGVVALQSSARGGEAAEAPGAAGGGAASLSEGVAFEPALGNERGWGWGPLERQETERGHRGRHTGCGTGGHVGEGLFPTAPSSRRVCTTGQQCPARHQTRKGCVGRGPGGAP